MSDASTHTVPGRLCRECKQPIPDNAVKCHHCSSHQDWRRFLGLGSTVAAFVLTLLSIWAVPSVYSLFQAQTADLHFSVIGGDDYKISLMLSNSGNRAAVLTGIELNSRLKNGGVATYFLRSDRDHQLIEPGKSWIVDAGNGEVIPKYIERIMQMALRERKISAPECSLDIHFVQFSGAEEIYNVPFPCMPLLNSASADGLLKERTQKPRGSD